MLEYSNYGSWRIAVGIHKELSQIRAENQSTTKQKAFSIVSAITIGVILGLAAKLVDAQGLTPYLTILVGV
ncbi:hypothetical protein MT997_26805 [Paenibacillus sp. OVF10]|nr:hypothetical protein MT997_26805 [Paenibacillus sp. OVF10]